MGTKTRPVRLVDVQAWGFTQRGEHGGRTVYRPATPRLQVRRAGRHAVRRRRQRGGDNSGVV